MMKKIICVGLLSLVAVSMAYGQNEETKDSVVVNRPRKVTIVTTDKSQRIDVMGSEKDATFHYSKTIGITPETQSLTRETSSDWQFKIPFGKSKSGCSRSGKYRSHFDITAGALFVGFNSAPGAPAGMDVSMGSSWEIAFQALGFNWKPRRGTTFTIALDMDWRNYRMTGTSRFIKDGADVKVGSYPAGSDIKFSRIKIFSLNVPFLIKQKFGNHGPKVYMGPVVSFNTHASIKTRYIASENGNVVEHKDTDNNIHPTPVTLSFLGGIGFNSTSVYVKYSPSNVLQTDYAPKFHSLSVGMSFFF